MFAIGTSDSWDGHSLRLSLLSGPHCPLCGDTTTWAGGAWPHFFSDCAGTRTVLQRSPALDWLLLISTTVSPGFALFSAASTFSDAVSRLLGYIFTHGDVSSTGRGERVLPDHPADTAPLASASPPSLDGSMATIVCLREGMDTATGDGEGDSELCFEGDMTGLDTERGGP